MRVTLLGAAVALALGTASCDGSSRTHARDETAGGEAREAEALRETEREGERKGKMEGREPTEAPEAEEEMEEGDREPRRAPDNPALRQFNVLDQPNPTNP